MCSFITLSYFYEYYNFATAYLKNKLRKHDFYNDMKHPGFIPNINKENVWNFLYKIITFCILNKIFSFPFSVAFLIRYVFILYIFMMRSRSIMLQFHIFLSVKRQQTWKGRGFSFSPWIVPGWTKSSKCNYE